jgi:hypothetical protein
MVVRKLSSLIHAPTLALTNIWNLAVNCQLSTKSKLLLLKYLRYLPQPKFR